MEWVRSENWEGVRVESAAMMTDVDVSSIVGSCAFGLCFSDHGGGRRMWLFMYVGECVGELPIITKINRQLGLALFDCIDQCVLRFCFLF